VPQQLHAQAPPASRATIEYDEVDGQRILKCILTILISTQHTEAVYGTAPLQALPRSAWSSGSGVEKRDASRDEKRDARCLTTRWLRCMTSLIVMASVEDNWRNVGESGEQRCTGRKIVENRVK